MADGGKVFASGAVQWFALFRERNNMEYRAIPVVGWVTHPHNHGDLIVEGYLSAPPQAADDVLIPARRLESTAWEAYNHELVGYRTEAELEMLAAAQTLPLNTGWVGEDMNYALWPEHAFGGKLPEGHPQ